MCETSSAGSWPLQVSFEAGPRFFGDEHRRGFDAGGVDDDLIAQILAGGGECLHRLLKVLALRGGEMIPPVGERSIFGELLLEDLLASPIVPPILGMAATATVSAGRYAISFDW